ncbi:MAG: hypothetical protein KME03_15585 [Aphanocapsa lilacina HA4352-LM1]|jgi:glycogen operon protein|nr:hypothetical protein [Aphanocapsa lilacina HA4352-LM1]
MASSYRSARLAPVVNLTPIRGRRCRRPLRPTLWNCGVEGPTDDREIEALQLRQIKNCLTVLFVSQGTPMLAMGDEVRRTQRGNNNAYCQNSELSWFDWSVLEKNADPLRFTRALIHFSQSLKLTQLEHILAFAPDGERPYAVLHGVRVHQPDLSGDSHALALGLHYPGAGEHLHVLLNAYWEALDFELPLPPPGLVWHRIVDTARPAPEDIAGRPDAPPRGHLPGRGALDGRAAGAERLVVVDADVPITQELAVGLFTRREGRDSE